MDGLPIFIMTRTVRVSRRCSLSGAVGVFLLAVAGAGAAPLSYNKDIRPILFDNCFRCHGPDSASRKAGLRLDRFDEATKANEDGVAAIVPGDLSKSALVSRITTQDMDDRMPPPESHKELKPAQIETLQRWITEGAKYEAHWSFIAPVRPPVPAVENAAWSQHPIDAFIFKQMQAAALSPNPEADRRTLARRASLDLTGLPPEPALAEEFVNDAAPGAWERLLDKLMASPHYGEHRARYWLDAARYADTHGIHFDNYREMWHYRQWVIEAFNRNQPFDRFTIEQLAGDLLPDKKLNQQIASGFNRCNITTNEGGAIAEEYLVLYARDRTETTSQVFMGLTTGCAVCHDHKFDPITMKEFYSLSAFFNNTTQNAMDGNIKDTPPVLFVPDDKDRPRWDAIEGEIAAAKKAMDERRGAARPDFENWLVSAKPDIFTNAVAPDELRIHAPLDEAGGESVLVKTPAGPSPVTCGAGAGAMDGVVSAKAFKVAPGKTAAIPQPDGFEHDKPFSYGAWVRLPAKNLTGAAMARMEEGPRYRGWDLWIQGNRPGAHIVSAWPQDAVKVVGKKPLKPNEWHHVFVTYNGSGKAAGVKVYVDGEVQEKDTEADDLKSSIRNELPLKFGQRDNSSRLDNLGLQDVRLYNRLLNPAEVAALPNAQKFGAILTKAPDQRSAAEKDAVFNWWLPSSDKAWKDASAKLAALEQEQGAIRQRGAVTHVMSEKSEPPTAFILARGEYDKRRDPVSPETPASLPKMPDDLPRNRLGLAQWLLRPEHPLMARVTVNRFWQELFGNGLVRTAGDFGVSGELPSHPELLDWLAVEFRESGWDVKKFFRLVMTSAAYRQSAAGSPEKYSKDIPNRLLSRGPRFRMDAEMVRDYALASSGIMARRIGGPSVRPYQPEGIWEAVAMPESNTRNYKRDTGEGLYRRSLYTLWKRAAPPASMDIFNAPAREVCTVRRERTNTPLQALVTLNDVQFVEAARFLAERTIKEGGAKFESRLDFMVRRILSRPPAAEELPVLTASHADLTAYYKVKPDEAKALLTEGDHKSDPALDPAELATWTMMANQLLNLDEALNK
jgi:Protein of unknown function (DUF1553)/Protein of unknown function (DUF1549)/Planctomycete cytochrome C/Concanavalin A-like lectin/glucanases superfamily